MSEIIIDSQDPGITINPTFTNLNVYTGGYACAQGNTTQVQYNNGGVLAGANGLTYISGNTTTISNNLVVSSTADLGDVGNITITGGNAGEFLQTDGSGGLSFANVANANYANVAGTVLTAAQPNITSVGTLSNLTVSGNVTASYFIGNGSQLTGIGDIASISNGNSNVRVLANSNVTIGVGGNANVLVATSTGIVVNAANLGNVGNLKITGGNNGFVLQTDGTGNLTWTAMTGNAGNGVVGGSNTQIQYNDSGAFGGSAGFTFNKASNLLSAPGGITAVGNVSGNYILGNGSLLTGIITSANSIENGNSNVVVDANANIRFSVTGTANVIIVATNDVTYNANLSIVGKNVAISNGNFNITGTGTYNGNGSGLSNITAANITGTVANATHACTANTVTNAAQSNITSLGTLTGLNVNGNIISANITANTGVFTGNANGLSNIPGANVTGTVANATYAVNAGSANTAANATYATSAGSANTATTAGTVTTAAQPNITSVGTLSSLTVSGNISGTIITAAQPNITSLGNLTSLTVIGTGKVQQIKEKININANGAGGNTNFDILDGAIVYYSGASTSNVTLNFRGNNTTTFDSIISNNESLTATFMMTNSGAGYYLASNIKIDGSNVTTYWISPGPGTLFTGLDNSTVVYNFNIIKSAGIYTALGTIIGFI